VKTTSYKVMPFLGEAVPWFAYWMVCVLIVGVLFPRVLFYWTLLMGIGVAVCGIFLLYVVVAVVGLVDYAHWRATQRRQPPSDPPEGPTPLRHRGKPLVDGVDYYGDHDRELIERYGYDGLNFCPSTPPEYR